MAAVIGPLVPEVSFSMNSSGPRIMDNLPTPNLSYELLLDDITV
jgi:hypothetical protein